MSEWAITILKVGFLALLWVFVLICSSTIRADMFGHAVTASGGQPTKPVKSGGRAARNQPPRLLRVVQGRQQGLELALAGPIEIGRGPTCQLLLDDDFCSTKHATIAQDRNGGWYVLDHNSTNGTFVNDTRISVPTSIGLADDVRIGRTIFKLVP